MSSIFDKLKKITKSKGYTKKSGGAQDAGGDSPFGAPPGLDNVPDFGAAPPFGEVPNMGGPPVALPPFGEVSSPPGMPSEQPGGAPPAFPPMDGAAGFPPMGAPAQAQQDSELSRDNAEKISDIKDQIAKMNVSISAAERTSTEMSETVKKIDESVLELLSLYEMVSNQVNPFVGDGATGSETIERFDKIEKRLNAFSEITSMVKNELDSLGTQQVEHIEGLGEKEQELLQSIEGRFESFGQSIAAIHEDVENLSVRINELEEMDIDELIRDNVAEAMKLVFTEGGVAESLAEAGEQPVKTAVGVAGNEPSKIRLEKLDNDPMTAIVLLNWIEFLMERVGRNNLMEALDYYIDIGWISEDVRNEILAYARGIDYYVEKPTWRLLPEDHTKSLIFIERLMGRKIDRTQLNTVEREMSKVKHSMEELYGI